jgi:hypothetical protein
MVTEVATMKIATVREFRDHATALLRGDEPILVMRRGSVAGVFFPQPGQTIPIELKREMYPVLSAEVARQFKRRGLTEKALLADFKEWRRARREGRRGR